MEVRFQVGKFCFFSALLLVAFVFWPGHPALSQSGIQFSITDLGTLGGTDSFAHDVNNNGQVVGYSLTTGAASLHAFSWTQAGGWSI